MEELKQFIIAIEGGVCSGKSSICKKFEENGFSSIKGHGSLKTERDIQNLKEIKTEDKIFKHLEIEELRKEFLETKLSDSDNIILDRSYLSIFAFEFAKGRYDMAKNYELYLDKCIKPDLIIFLDVDNDKRERRAIERDGNKDKLGFLLDDKFNNSIKTFFKSVKNENIVFIDTNNKNIQEVQKIIEKEILLTKSNQISKSQ